MFCLVFFLLLLGSAGMVQINTVQSLQLAWKLARTFQKNQLDHCSQIHTGVSEEDVNTHILSHLGNLPKNADDSRYAVMFQLKCAYLHVSNIYTIQYICAHISHVFFPRFLLIYSFPKKMFLMSIFLQNSFLYYFALCAGWAPYWWVIPNLLYLPL